MSLSVTELIAMGITGMVIPWCVFVTANIYGLQKEIALIKQMLEILTERVSPS